VKSRTLDTPESFTEVGLPHLWAVLQDICDASAVELTAEGFITIRLEVSGVERFTDFWRIVKACERANVNVICSFHNGRTADAGRCLYFAARQ
jgi:hypothetical protein